MVLEVYAWIVILAGELVGVRMFENSSMKCEWVKVGYFVLKSSKYYWFTIFLNLVLGISHARKIS